MTDGIHVNHGALLLGADQMQETMNRIEGRLTQLEGELEVLKSDWSGEAQQTYLIAKAKWDAAIDEMQVLLKDTAESVRISQQDYAAADARGAAQFGG